MSDNVDMRIKRLLEETRSEGTRKEARLSGDSKRWTRQRAMPLQDMLLCTLAKKGLTTVMELEHYFNEMKEGQEAVSKQAYLRQRQKLNPEVFRTLNRNYLKGFYSTGEAKTWRGYLLFAIDGSKVEIPNSAENRREYGQSKNQHGVGAARADCSNLHDVCNGFILDIGLSHYQSSEITAAKAHIPALKAITGDRPTLIIYDRYYASLEFMDYLEQAGVKYLMRLQAGAYKAEIGGMQGADGEAELVHNRHRMKACKRNTPERAEVLKQRGATHVRVIKTTFKNGEQGTLITNLREGSADGIVRLYRKRWSIEQRYHTMKNKMKFESVTGKASVYVRQDFWAQMLVFNIMRDLMTRAERRAAAKAQKKGLRYGIRVNENIAIGLFKDWFIRLMVEEDPDRKDALFKRLIAKMESHIVPVRTLKSSPRCWNKSNKYKCNLKPSF